MKVLKGSFRNAAIVSWAIAAFFAYGAYQFAGDFLSDIHAGFSRGRELSLIAFFLFGIGLTLIVMLSLIALYTFRRAFRVTGVLLRKSKPLETRLAARPVGNVGGTQPGSLSKLESFLWIVATITIVLIFANTVAVLLILIQEHALGSGGGEFYFRAFNKLLEQTILPLVLVALLVGLAGLVERLDQLRSGSSQND